VGKYLFALCDDNGTVADIVKHEIEKILRDLDKTGDVVCYTDALTLESDLSRGTHYDAFFLDVDMPGRNGLELAAAIRDSDRNVPIVFVSGKEEYVFDSFKVRPYAFVRKRILKREFLKLIPDLLKKLDSSEEYWINFESGGVSFRMNPLQIIYADVVNKSLHIVSEKREFNIRYPLSAFEQLVSSFGFLRIHKSYLVNYRYVFSIDTDTVRLDDGTTLPLSKHRTKEVKEEFRGLVS